MNHDEMSATTRADSAADDRSSPRCLMPDIAQDTVAAVGGCLDRVGMSGIEIAVKLRSAEGELVLTPARAAAQISLDDADAKGIHMSRLFLVLQESFDEHELRLPVIEDVLRKFLDSHQRLARTAYLSLSFEYLAKRSSLLSNHLTWRSYPVEIQGRLSQGVFQHRLRAGVAYSSTCPCSAALARQLLQQQFQEDYADHRWLSVSRVASWLGSQGTLATPHSQRSHADVTVALGQGCDDYPIVGLIDAIERAVATPVQAAVKRSDEQAFARLNGENLMFCEDSARRIRLQLEAEPVFTDYRIQASHFESLHPHDAVAIVTKGIPGGLQA